MQRGRDPHDLSDGRARSVHGRDPRVGRDARVRRQPARGPRPQGPRSRGPPRLVQPLVPALLALRPSARLPGDLLVVREGHRVPRSHGRAQSADHVGARARQGGQFRQVAGQRPRLVDQPQPLLGLADPGVEERRPRPPADRRVRGHWRRCRPTSESPSTTSTGRPSTSSPAPTRTIRPDARRCGA